MSKPDLTAAVARAIGIPEAHAENLVRQVFETVAAQLLEDGEVYVDGFGTFRLRVSRARRARNPRTGARINILPRVIAEFTPTPNLDDQLLKIANDQVGK